MDTKEKILSAAIEVFAEKGKHGTRMEEIAVRASVNKAMLYYFFTTKEKLFQEVLITALFRISKRITDGITQQIDAMTDPRDKVTLIVNKHFDAYSQSSDETNILLSSMTTCPADVEKAAKKIAEEHPAVFCPEKFVSFFEECKATKLFRNIDPRQTLVSIVGMNLIYFAAKPISQLLLNINVNNEQEFLKERQASIVDLILHGILTDPEPPHTTKPGSVL
ncbi:MAG: TetR/AcrR family transcriptional regulator [Elusimicrobia bacterium]|nr:TetR/AcrR family transcriptional regulator [Elusimicrobiota bacterium]